MNVNIRRSYISSTRSELASEILFIQTNKQTNQPSKNKHETFQDLRKKRQQNRVFDFEMLKKYHMKII